ncbi:hypothetical protein BHE97_16300 [Aeromicrobium sp. PE09-221]|uniref:acyl-CoA dehydrogenase family protein n=1 Tax=Aeromicrobium sp. PE09-221 TaxID=1898043 RepID=UPI000B3ED08C|nr:acyl-CoA dehydrogenase family protein [Aeromicrobium sp. PE09-221]OUZ07656.1 hypothetical protein BHE97_16300 [Aeromicrobium sp. PE09-221]
MTDDQVLSQEHRVFQQTMRRFFDKAVPESYVRDFYEGEAGFDPAMWRRLDAEFGLPGLAVPEEFGGSGAGLIELVLVMEEMGRCLLPSPFLGSAGLATSVLLRLGDTEVNTCLVPRLVSSGDFAALAVTVSSGDWSEDAVSVRAEGGGDDTFRLSGTVRFVLDGDLAPLLLVAARTTSGISLFEVEPDARGLDRQRARSLDPTRRLATVVMHDVDGRLVGHEGTAWPAIRRGLDDAALLLAAEQVGAAERCMDLSVEYARTRHQFGRPIGSFQAIKHKCADMLLRVESARSAVYAAAFALDQANPQASRAVDVAAAYSGDAFSWVAKEMIQVHGGIGFTWEHPAHWYFRRATSSAALFGSATARRRRIAAALGMPC